MKKLGVRVWYTEWSKSHATHKSDTRENVTIVLVVIFILYVGTTVSSPHATGAGATLTPSSTPSVEWERYLWQDFFFRKINVFLFLNITFPLGHMQNVRIRLEILSQTL
jgi:hypothetical protein